MPPPTLALDPAPPRRPAGEMPAPSRFGRTRSARRDRLRSARGPDAPGPPWTRRGLTVGAFLESWLTEVVRGTVRPRTYTSYRYVVDLHLAPGLGDLGLGTLSPADVQAFLNAKAASGLSPRTVGYASARTIALVVTAPGLALRIAREARAEAGRF